MAIHTRQELSALTLLEEGLETRNATAPGGWPDREVMRRTHLDMLELQDQMREAAADDSIAGDQSIRWRAFLVAGLAMLAVIAGVLLLVG